MLTARSVQGVLIRLTDERWDHIVETHRELRLGKEDVMYVVARPEVVVEGPAGELLAVREIGKQRWVVVVYRIVANDGFVITAFRTARRRAFERWKQIWP